VKRIAVTLGGGNNQLTERMSIPEGKTVYLITSSDSATLTPAKGLEVRGVVIVGESVTLAAETSGKIYLPSTGVIQIEDGGTLKVETRATVVDLSGAPALKRVQYDRGSALTIMGEGGVLDITAITALWDETISTARSVGTSKKQFSELNLEDALDLVKPSDFQSFAAGTGPAISAIPAKNETEKSLTIPAGVVLAPKVGVLNEITDLTVAGGLKAVSVGSATTGVTVVVKGNATLEVANDLKFNAGSTIETGGAFNGIPADNSAITAAPGAKINGSVVKEGTTTVLVYNATQLNTLTTGNTYQVVKSLSGVTASITVTSGATLYIPNGVTVTFSGGGIAATSAGTVIVEGTGTIDGFPKLSSNYINGSNNSGVPNLAGLKILSSTTSLSAGAIAGIDIKLGGKIQPVSNTTQPYLSSDAVTYLWSNGGNSKPSGYWSWGIIDNILPGTPPSGMTIKQFNDSFHYYAHDTAIGDVSSDPLTGPKTNGTGSIYLPTDSTLPYKWRTYNYDASNSEKSGAIDTTTGNGFGVLFWSAANPKKATIEITLPPVTTGQVVTPERKYTATVDWSGVVFVD
jgi:hypothetical protein